MRAVSENQQLAALAGVDVRQTIRIVWLLGAALAAVAGVMAGLLVQIRPHMGHDLLLPLFAAAQRLRANIRFGMTIAAPPNAADKAPCQPAITPATAAASKVATL